MKSARSPLLEKLIRSNSWSRQTIKGILLCRCLLHWPRTWWDSDRRFVLTNLFLRPIWSQRPFAFVNYCYRYMHFVLRKPSSFVENILPNSEIKLHRPCFLHTCITYLVLFFLSESTLLCCLFVVGVFFFWPIWKIF